MDRRNFFKACAGIIAGVVLLPLKAVRGKEAKPLPDTKAGKDSSPRNCYKASQANEKEQRFCHQAERCVYFDPTQCHNYYDQHKQAFVDWAKDIRDEMQKEQRG